MRGGAGRIAPKMPVQRLWNKVMMFALMGCMYDLDSKLNAFMHAQLQKVPHT